MSASYRIDFLGNVADCRTEAEVSLREAPPGADPLCALVYETDTGPVVEWFGIASQGALPPGFTDAVEGAKHGLLAYKDRRGENSPEGLTRAGLSLWLLEKADGTAMGINLRSAT